MAYLVEARRSWPAFLLILAGAAPSCLAGVSRPTDALTRVEEVLTLLPAEARRHRPVRLRGLVTYADPEASVLFIQDPTGGVLVLGARPGDLRPGQRVEVVGTTDAGPSPPAVRATAVEVLGEAPLPPPRRVVASHLKSESTRYQWIEFEGRIAAFREAGRTRLLIHEYREFVALHVRDLKGTDPASLVGPGRRVRGVYGPVLDERGQTTGYRIWVPSVDFIEQAASPTFPVPAGVEAARSDRPVLTRAEQVLALTPEEAARGHPVRLQGVVTYYDAEWCMLFVQDATAGVYVQCRPHEFEPALGQRVELKGITGPGEYSPMVEEPRLRPLGRGRLPAPWEISFEQLSYGLGDSQWIQVRGAIQSVQRVGVRHAGLEVASSAGRTRVVLPDLAELPRHLLGRETRFRGVGIGVFNKKRQLVGAEVLCPSLDQIELLEPAPADPFALPVQPVDSLLRFSPRDEVSRRARIQGVVTHQRPGGSFYIVDQSGALQVQTAEAVSLRPGDRLDVIGFPTRGEYAPVLRGAGWRRLGTGPAPVPADIAAEQGLSGDYDSALVRIQGRLLDRAAVSSNQVLILQAAPFVFEASLDGPEPEALGSLRSGSLLRLTGICSVQVDDRQVPHSFRVLLRAPSDIVVLESAPWWTLRHTLWLLAVMAAGVSAALAWVALLKRRVRARTEALRVQTTRYRELVENANDAIYTLDVRGRFTSLNPAGEQITGYTSAELLDREMAGLVADAQRDFAGQMLGRQLSAGEPAVYELDLLAKDGHPVRMEVSSRPIREQGRIVGVEGLGRDVTERRLAQEMKAQISAVLEERSRIARDLHDSLDQGFWGILLQLEATAQSLGQTPERARTHLDLARSLVLHNQAEAHRSVWDLRSPVLERSDVPNALAAMARQVRANGTAEIATEVVGTPRPLPAFVENNLLRIGQEAITNAVKHAQARSIRAELRFDCDAVRLVVKDDGCGFDVRSPAHTQQGHFGLIGMHERAKRMGGRLKVESAPGAGSTVTVELSLGGLGS